MVDLAYCQTDLLFFDIPLLYYSIYLNSSIICRLSSGDLSFGISVLLSEQFCCELFETFVILWALFFASQCTSCLCYFLNCSFWSSFKCICCRSFTMIKKVSIAFCTQIFAYIFTNAFIHIFSKRQKSVAFHKYSIFWFSLITHFL